MVSEAPPFWWTRPDWRAYALWPVSRLYGLVAGRRMRKARRADVPVPVICVGNFTVGGAGKTPTAIAIARAAKARGLKPGFLSRGYGGTLDVTTVVDPHHHRARAVGDEPLLLAREALTVISRKRAKGAMKLVEEGADLIIMDDGFQSGSLPSIMRCSSSTRAAASAMAIWCRAARCAHRLASRCGRRAPCWPSATATRRTG